MQRKTKKRSQKRKKNYPHHPTNKQDFHLFLENVFSYSSTMQPSWFQFTIISISILVFRVLSTWQLFEPLWVWFMINDKDDQTLKWQEEEYNYTWICSWFNHIFKVIFNQNVSVRADWKNVQSFHTASYSPESVQKSHKPLGDHKLLTATLTWESPAPQRSKEQRGGCITAQLGGRGEWRTEART